MVLVRSSVVVIQGNLVTAPTTSPALITVVIGARPTPRRVQVTPQRPSAWRRACFRSQSSVMVALLCRYLAQMRQIIGQGKIRRVGLGMLLSDPVLCLSAYLSWLSYVLLHSYFSPQSTDRPVAEDHPNDDAMHHARDTHLESYIIFHSTYLFTAAETKRPWCRLQQCQASSSWTSDTYRTTSQPRPWAPPLKSFYPTPWNWFSSTPLRSQPIRSGILAASSLATLVWHIFSFSSRLRTLTYRSLAMI